jgi:D-serine deaminase-like pyridoxal phosphate-dependent protein
MKLETLKTPGLVLDIAKVKRNAAEMSASKLLAFKLPGTRAP